MLSTYLVGVFKLGKDVGRDIHQRWGHRV